ncbi:MAG: hypothetical protein PHC34_14050 [Candidatus Gastranaerophilales bacterium]|nr:hypothetical protein [Candidatus Gastranaerophilales bacterium]
MSDQSEEENALKKIINNARYEILVKKNPKNVIIELYNLLETRQGCDNASLKQILALAYLENRNYKEASEIYQELDEKYQAGYCELLLGNEDNARKFWFYAPESGASSWGRCLIEFINVKVKQIPTFLQVRNHLESDLGYLIRADQLTYTENIIKCGEILTSINPESYKFIGRALMNNGFANLAINYFLKSQKMIPQDPEIYFHLGQYSYIVGAYEEGKKMLRQCIEMNKFYTPAVKLLEKLSHI